MPETISNLAKRLSQMVSQAESIDILEAAIMELPGGADALAAAIAASESDDLVNQ